MLGRDPALEDVRRRERCHRAGEARCGQEPHRLGDLVVVPAGAVLVGEQHQPPVAHARVTARVLQEHQRQQRDQGGLVGPQGQHHPHQPDRLPGELGAEQVGAGAGGVAGGEGEVGGLRERVEPVGQDGGVRDGERDAGTDDALLGAGDPGRHRGLRDEEQPRDVGGGHAEHEAQAECGG